MCDKHIHLQAMSLSSHMQNSLFFCRNLATVSASRTRKTQNQKRERSREFVGVRGSLRELKGTQGNWVKINLACSHTNMNHLGVVNHSHDYFPSNRLSNFQMIFVQSVPGSACHFSRKLSSTTCKRYILHMFIWYED